MFNQSTPLPRRSILYPLFSVLFLAVLFTAAGCSVFGLAAQAMPKYVKAAYPDLKGQKTALMVVSDRGVRLDWPNLNLDATSAIQIKLQKLQKEQNPSELKDVVWPYEPKQMVRYQRDHPELELTSPTDTAQKINVTRLIYVEINQFTTRSEMASQLFKGKAVANVHVIEVNGDKAKDAWSQVVTVTFPPKTKEGLLNADDYRIYLGTLELFSNEVMNLFVEHQVE